VRGKKGGRRQPGKQKNRNIREGNIKGDSNAVERKLGYSGGPTYGGRRLIYSRKSSQYLGMKRERRGGLHCRSRVGGGPKERCRFITKHGIESQADREKKKKESAHVSGTEFRS